MKLQLLLASLIVCLVGCQSTNLVIDGKGAVIKILCDDGITKDTDAVQARRLKEVGYWISDDFFKRMTEANFKASVVQSEKDYNPDAGEYLLKIKIDRYQFRPIGTYLDTSYELIGKQLLVKRSHGCGTGRNWRNCCEKLNKDMLDVVANKIILMNLTSSQ